MLFIGLVFSLTYQFDVALLDGKDQLSVQRQIHFGLAFALLISLVIGLRHNVGTDYRTYVEYFERFASGTRTPNVEWGYALLNRAVAWVGGATWLVFLVSALATNVIVLRNLMKRSPYLWLSVLILFGIGFFFRQTNQVRQMVALALVFQASYYIGLQKFLYFTFFVVLAGAFHTTAYLFFPFYWISRWYWPRWLLIVLLLISMVAFVTPLGTFLVGRLLYAMTPATYSHYVHRVLTNTGYVDSGLRILGESGLVLVLLALLRGTKSYAGQQRVCYNLAIFGFIGQALFAPFWALHRIPVYFLFFQSLFFPQLLDRNFSKQDRLIVGCLIAVYFLFFAVYGVSRGTHGINPYSSVLFDL